MNLNMCTVNLLAAGASSTAAVATAAVFSDWSVPIEWFNFTGA